MESLRARDAAYLGASAQDDGPPMKADTEVGPHGSEDETHPEGHRTRQFFDKVTAACYDATLDPASAHLCIEPRTHFPVGDDRCESDQVGGAYV